MRDSYKPPFFLHNTHLQAVLSSSRIRGRRLAKQHKAFLANTESHILQTTKGVRLQGELNRCKSKSQSLIVLFHGWEGSSRSNYVVSAAAHLNKHGHDVFRLNFRDHGNTHHLNEGIFNSTLVEEVAEAIDAIYAKGNWRQLGIMGFSLGGSFALRVGLRAKGLDAPLNSILAVCPVLDPSHTMHVLETGPFFYEYYFVKKWKRSLFKKLAHFPHYNYGRELSKMKRLREMNEYFIPRYTGFKNVESYFDGYTVTGDRLANLACKTQIITSLDDPVIPASDFTNIAQPETLNISTQHHGSHCAFLHGLSLPSWVDEYAKKHFSEILLT